MINFRRGCRTIADSVAFAPQSDHRSGDPYADQPQPTGFRAVPYGGLTAVGDFVGITILDQNQSDLAIGRLDDLCNFFHKPGGASRERSWPPALQSVADRLAGDLERLAGALDQADNNRAALRELINDAVRELPETFAAFGTAVAKDLAAAFLRRHA